ncbi:MAG: hypothetical protein WC601_04740 [Desulfotomaculaceae bacterium]
MNWTKYEVALLIFTAVVALGTSTAISQFNHRVSPQTPVRVFELKNDGQGVYQVKFLGESMRLELPVEYLAERIVIIRRYGESILDGPLVELNDVFEEWLNPDEAG